MRDKLADLGLASAPVTSGSKGLHLYAALPGRKNAEEVRDLAQQIAKELSGSHADLVLWQMTKAKRPGKVFLDWSQNTASKTDQPVLAAGDRRAVRRRAADLGGGRGGARRRTRCASSTWTR